MGRSKATSKNIDEKALLTTRPGVRRGVDSHSNPVGHQSDGTMRYVGQVGKASAGLMFGEVEWCCLYLVNFFSQKSFNEGRHTTGTVATGTGHSGHA